MFVPRRARQLRRELRRLRGRLRPEPLSNVIAALWTALPKCQRERRSFVFIPSLYCHIEFYSAAIVSHGIDLPILVLLPVIFERRLLRRNRIGCNAVPPNLICG